MLIGVLAGVTADERQPVSLLAAPSSHGYTLGRRGERASGM
jgi:hypothetical protein